MSPLGSNPLPLAGILSRSAFQARHHNRAIGNPWRTWPVRPATLGRKSTSLFAFQFHLPTHRSVAKSDDPAIRRLKCLGFGHGLGYKK